MAGPVPAIGVRTVEVQIAGTGPTMTRATHASAGFSSGYDATPLDRLDGAGLIIACPIAA
jgi:hypothetical protein